VAIFALPIHVSVQNGVSQEYTTSVKSWSEEFWNSLGKMWKVYPTRPVYMMIAKGNFGPEMGFTISYPDSFRVVIDLNFPSQTRATVAHELMHVFQFAWIKRNKRLMPLWVMEGLATWYGGKEGTYSSPLGENPFLFWSVDPVKLTKYPETEEAKGEYYAEVYALFNAMDKKCDFEKSLPSILDSVANGKSWKESLSEALNENFDDFYSEWRRSNLIFISLKFASFWGIWTGLPLLLIILFFFKRSKRKNKELQEDDLEELEEKYGKDYWKGGKG
jgi:hypothetical protein